MPKFHLDPIWNDKALGFLKSVIPNKKNTNKNNKISSNMASVPDPIIIQLTQTVSGHHEDKQLMRVGVKCHQLPGK